MPTMRRVTWVGGPQDGGVVEVRDDVTWVAVLEDRRDPGYKHDPAKNDAPPRSLMRYTVPIIDGKIVWGQRVQANPGDGEI